MALRQLFSTSAFSLCFAFGCGSDSDETPSGGAGKAGSAGTGGASGGAGGSSGSSGTGGSSGSGGVSASVGSAGAGGSAGADGAVGSAGTGATDGGAVTDGSAGQMSFFVSSKGVDGSGNLGGLSGADQHCANLARAAGSTKTHWVAYLSAENGGGGSAVNARDRIGSGPWYNSKGQLFAASVAALHPTIDPAVDRAGYIAAKPADALFLDETGQSVPGAQHDILTGSNGDGTLATGRTCSDWTSASTTLMARVGHSDTPATQFSPSWNAAHDSASCSVQGLIERGGAGRLYCFATD